MADFWLPAEFLDDEDDDLMYFEPKKELKNKSKVAETDSVFGFPFDFSSGCNSFNSVSGLSSPDESIVSSESEEEEQLAGLTQKMAKSTLLDDLWKAEAQKSHEIPIFPQSTRCGCKEQGPSRGSPNCPTRRDAEWEFLIAAAREIKRKKMIEEATVLGYPNAGSLSYQQLELLKLQHMERELLVKQAMAAEAQAKTWPYRLPPQTRHVAQPGAMNRQAANLSTLSFSPHQQQSLLPHQQQLGTSSSVSGSGSGLRAVFLGNTGPKREPVGTGVFLPRGAGGVTEPRKNSGCSTVLLPDRVVQALNLDLQAVGAQSRVNNAFNSDFGVNMRNNVPMAPKQKLNLHPTVEMAHAELRLPQEWTY